MLYQNSKRLGLLLVFFVFFTLACQEDNLREEIDPEMEQATAMADHYLFSLVTNQADSKTRRGRDAIDDIDRSITVLKFHKDRLVYKTNTDDKSGYDYVGETTVTAYVNPGEYIFWFAGGGISMLDSIDFDNESVEFLDELPEYLLDYEMWVVKVPEDYDPEHNVLKYDIVYETRENAGIKIRLDPKIQIKSGEDVEVEISVGD